jgi:hypothetical protein
MMTQRELEILNLENRIHKLSNAGDKNVKCPGVLKKLRRKMRNLNKA